MSSSDRALIAAFKEISTMADRINLPKTIVDRANNLFKQVHDGKNLKGRSNDAKASACLYIACRQEGVPRTFKEICAVSKISKKEIGRCFKLTLKALATSVDLITTADFMSRFCANLGNRADKALPKGLLTNSLSVRSAEHGATRGDAHSSQGGRDGHRSGKVAYLGRGGRHLHGVPGLRAEAEPEGDRRHRWCRRRHHSPVIQADVSARQQAIPGGLQIHDAHSPAACYISLWSIFSVHHNHIHKWIRSRTPFELVLVKGIFVFVGRNVDPTSFSFCFMVLLRMRVCNGAYATIGLELIFNWASDFRF